MSLTTAIRDHLAADAPLAALLIGGIYTFAQTGRGGISRATTPAANDSFLQPCAVIKAGALESVAIRDSAATRRTVEIYLYDDGDSGYASIDAASALIVVLLDRRWLPGAGSVRHIGGALDLRDPKLNNAALVRLDFEVIA